MITPLNAHTAPLDGPEQLAAALREQGLPEDEISAATQTLLPLAEWTAPAPTPDATRQLIERLLPLAQGPASPTQSGQVLRARTAGLAGEFWLMLRLVRTQVSILAASFWLASAVVVALGWLLVAVAPSLSRSLVLQVTGPLLAYIGTASAFRAGGLHMLEFELACPPSPRQLTLARLSLVLSYDLALGLLLNLLLWPRSGAAFWPLGLHWLAPLLLAAGATLLLSLRLPIGQAAALTYTGWVIVLALALINGSGVQSTVSAIPLMWELALGAAGLAMLAGMLLALPRAVPGMLPRRG